MNQPISIPKELPRESTLNYNFLREEGIRHIQRLAGHIWTDHNTHDPGITILEQLCYALTDLGYRIDNDIRDLLASGAGNSYQYLYSPAQVLTVNPLTLADIRKVVIDIPGVKNAWVEKVTDVLAHPNGGEEQAGAFKLKGLLRVFVEKMESAEASAELLGRVKARLQACRGLCEDFEEVRLLDPQFIRLQGTVEVGQTEDLNEFAADVLFIAASHISPQVPFYTLQQMQDKGLEIDAIFDGPALEHGFIDDYDLQRTRRKKELHTSDLIREIMDKKEVLALHDLSLGTGSETLKKWALDLDLSKTPKLDPKGTLNSLTFAKNGLNVRIDKERVFQLYLEKRDQHQYGILPEAGRDIVSTEAKDRNLESYYTIQNHFPSNYGIGELGLSAGAPAERQAQAKQLRAYLLFFEQILANSFSQVAHFKDLMSFEGEDRRTYFQQSLIEAIPGLEEILNSPEDYEQYLDGMAADTLPNLERKNRFLNHLLARFSESFTDYGMVLQDPEKGPGLESAQDLIRTKANFLKAFPELSSSRARGHNYWQETWDTENISGLEKRIAAKLGIEGSVRRNLGEGNQEGFHLVEHILLRPRNAAPHGPFSQEITAFEASDRTGFTSCTSAGHGLKVGAEIHIKGSQSQDGTYTVEQVETDSFEFEATFAAANQAETPRWEKTRLGLRDWVLSEGIQAFEASTRSGHSRCLAPGHGLISGQSIEILGTQNYNGTYTVTESSPGSFEIEKAFAGEESGARWRPSHMEGDPWSLQLSFVFPTWTERYQQQNFRNFVEQTVREESPAHLSLRTMWLDKNEMQAFDRAYREFLSQLKLG